MKKRILALASALVLVAVLVMPMAVFAGDTGVTGQVAGTPVVTSVNPDNLDPGTTATLITITGSGFENTGDTLVTMSGEGLTITESTYINETTVTFKLATASDAAAGERDVTVTQAGKAGTGTGIFTVNTVTTVSAPSGITLGYMVAGATKTGSSLDGIVTTNGETWQVTAKDVKGTNAGYMNTASDGSGTNLSATDKFQISKTAVDSGLEPADTGLIYNNSDGTTLKLYVSQVVPSAAAAGNYQITITYTVTTQ